MESMDKGFTVPKWVLLIRPKIPQMPQNLSAQIVCLGPKVWDFDEERLHWVSVVRGLKYQIESNKGISQRQGNLVPCRSSCCHLASIPYLVRHRYLITVTTARAHYPTSSNVPTICLLHLPAYCRLCKLTDLAFVCVQCSVSNTSASHAHCPY